MDTVIIQVLEKQPFFLNIRGFLFENNMNLHSNIRTSLKPFNFLLMPVGCIYILKVIFFFIVGIILISIFYDFLDIEGQTKIVINAFFCHYS